MFNIFKRNKKAKPAQVQPQPQVKQQQPQQQASDILIFGMGKDRMGQNVPIGIKKSERGHTVIMGSPGMGKSTLMLYQMLQDLRDGIGFACVDPHSDLARNLLTHIPPERWKDVVYIDPTTAYDFGRVVQFNFLQSISGVQKGMEIEVFLGALQKIYEAFWGPRLEMIAKNSLLAVKDARGDNATLRDFSRIMSDPSFRASILENVTDEDVLYFWEYEFRHIPPDATVAVQTKISRLLTDIMVRPMLSAQESSVDMRQLMDEGKIIIINLPEGRLTKHITAFIGSFLLSMMYMVAMSREDTPEQERKPFNIYVDEAHRFMTKVIADHMQAVRKYKIAMTIASQSIIQYGLGEEQKDKELREILPGLCTQHVVFSCGKEVAERFQEFFEPDLTYQDLMGLPKYMFALSALVNGVRKCGVLTTIDPKRGPYSEADVIKASLEKYGREVDVYSSSTKRVQLPSPELTPAEHLVLVYLADHKKVRRGVIPDQLKAKLGDPLRIEQAIYSLDRKGYVSRIRENDQDYYYINNEGWHWLYPYLTGARRGGSEHTKMLAKLRFQFWKQDCCPIVTSGHGKELEIEITYVDPGDGAKRKKEVKISSLPDLVVWRPWLRQERKQQYDPAKWDRNRILAVEVEVWPDHHMDRVIGHFKHARESGLAVLFAVPDQDRRRMVVDALRNAGANIVGDVFADCKVGNVEVRVVPPDPVPEDPHMKRQLEEAEIKEEDIVIILGPEETEKVAMQTGEVPKEKSSHEELAEAFLKLSDEEKKRFLDYLKQKEGVIPAGTKIYPSPEEIARRWVNRQKEFEDAAKKGRMQAIIEEQERLARKKVQAQKEHEEKSREVEVALSQKELLAKIAELEGKLKDYERVQARVVELEQKLKEIEVAPKKEEEKIEPVPEKLSEPERSESKKQTEPEKKIKIEEEISFSKIQPTAESKTQFRGKDEDRSIKEEIEKYMKMKWSFRILEKRGKKRLFARGRDESGKRKERYICTIDKRVERILKKFGIL